MRKRDRMRVEFTVLPAVPRWTGASMQQIPRSRPVRPRQAPMPPRSVPRPRPLPKPGTHR
ncbi:hypothetical protein J2S55_003623 [Streptosporangium brasiliense]|uniref:Uncharacterized protein n=1 Tax=Streptosporangium brasiliense TaxID=47480 RepID=A0ABT9R543_9ACTN|nr:hypothetical protein [Streptosporangium brasiliense]